MESRPAKATLASLGDIDLRDVVQLGARDAGAFGLLGNGCGDDLCDAPVEHARHDEAGVELVRFHDVGDGGVDSLGDLRRIEAAGLAGAIVGRALYDGRVTVPDAIRVLKGE